MIADNYVVGLESGVTVGNDLPYGLIQENVEGIYHQKDERMDHDLEQLKCNL